MQLKNFTRNEKKLLSKKRLNPDNWLLLKKTNETMTIVYKADNSVKKVINLT